MKEKLKFSVCIPNYNYGSYIDKTIQSVLNQNYEEFEIIIADNKSTDNSLSIIDSFKDKRIKVIKNNYNVGFAANLDIATESASGDFIILLSSDDIMKNNALENYAKTIKELKFNDNLVLFSGYDLIDGNGKFLSSRNALNDNIRIHGKSKIISFKNYDMVKGKEVQEILFSSALSSPGQFCTTCYSKNLYDIVHGYRSSTLIMPDATFMHKIGFTDADFIYVKKSLFQYRNHNSNNLSSVNKIEDIRLLTDKYAITQLNSNEDLKKINLTKKKLQYNFIKHYCINVPFYSFFRLNYLKSYHHTFFGLASYPKEMFKFWKFYFNIIFLPLLLIIYCTMKLFSSLKD
jgi:glycosyltransferase involved in cell wall biosynthesis